MSNVQIEPSAQIAGLLVLSPTIFYDLRGEFVATYNAGEYCFLNDVGDPIEFLEDDLAVSRYGVLRGLHGDDHTWKLIQCVVGEVYFVVADMRPTSATYLKWAAFALNDANRRQLLVPSGCASGMQCLSQRCTILYKQSHIYQNASHQFTVRWDDPKLGIYWPIREPILSERDHSAPYIA